MIITRYETRCFIINWRNVNSVKELKTLGSFKEVKECIRLDTKQKITARGWDDLFKNNRNHHTIRAILYLSVNRIHFYLVELDGEIRMNKLNITSKLFKDKKKLNHGEIKSQN